ncbi:MAG TPA: hypothetical protein IGS52_25825 [Oscillatoriaceae cyanobacterium M33_DOE_052]|nr:hypothetical protein [Oscillatoriaceae cyanobacterium M33_DOE_052]
MIFSRCSALRQAAALRSSLGEATDLFPVLGSNQVSCGDFRSQTRFLPRFASS